MKSSSFTRRQFLRAGAVASAAACSSSLLRAAPAHGMTIGLSQYSLRHLFTQKKLDPLDYPAFAKKTFGLTAIDVWDGGLPADRVDDRKYLVELKARAKDAGTQLFLYMAGTVEASGAPARPRKGKPANHPQSIENAATLGCQYVRFFASVADGAREDAVSKCADALAPLADRAKGQGITVVIEPGGSTTTKDGLFLVEVMKLLKHSHCRLMPDFGKMTGDIYAATRAMMPYTAVVSAKTHEFDSAGNQIEFDYFKLVRIIADARFRGILAIEWEGKKLDPIEGVHASKRLLERALAAV